MKKSRLTDEQVISFIKQAEGDKPAKKRFKSYPIGYFHVDIAEVQTAEGKLYLFVTIDRTSKFALTDNGIQFTNRSSDRYAFQHIFARVCEEHGIEHRLTKVKHPWTNGQVERMNRTIKEATMKRFHYNDHPQLHRHLNDFISA